MRHARRIPFRIRAFALVLLCFNCTHTIDAATDLELEVAVLVEKAGKGPTNVYNPAILRLREIGPPALIKMMQYGNQEVRSAGALALGYVGPTTKDVIPSLITTMRDESQDVRAHAAKSLGLIGYLARSEERKIVSACIKGLKDMSPLVRGSSAWALGHLYINRQGQAPKESVPPLIQALTDKDSYVRESASEALGVVGPVTKQVVPALVHQMQDPVSRVRVRVIASLGKIGHFFTSHNAEKSNRASVVLPPLIQALEDKDNDVRYVAAKALGDIGPVSENAVLALTHLLIDESSGVRTAAVSSLGSIGQKTDGIAPAITQFLNDDDPEVREYAIKALIRIGPKAKSAIPALKSALDDESLRVREAAAYALENIQGSVEGAK